MSMGEGQIDMSTGEKINIRKQPWMHDTFSTFKIVIEFIFDDRMSKLSQRKTILRTLEEMLEWQLMDNSDSDGSLYSHDMNSSSEDEVDSDDDIDDLFEVLRMDKRTFLKLLDRLKDHSIFQSESSHPQALVVVQLTLALDRLGQERNGVCIERSKELWGCHMVR
ncbi:hypothetical protein R1flu_014088 [Riccia fluitans]|uniref:Uncharacterized protein n=1 Tax=Riccia fluitans TaxID=41844 RepID=A0ABD1YF84_9MARC